MNFEFDAAIFDLDGTIIDSLGVWEKIDYDFLEKKRGIKVPEDYVHAIAPLSFKETAQYTKKRFNLSDSIDELMEEWTEMAIYEYSHNIFLKEGVREYLNILKEKNKKIALCTSSPDFFYKPVLKNNKIYEMFDVFTNTCEAGVGKNSPDVFLLAAKKCGVDRGKCLVFEDVINAAKSAKSAGMKVCGVFDERSRAHGEDMKNLCDFYIDSFKELIKEE